MIRSVSVASFLLFLPAAVLAQTTAGGAANGARSEAEIAGLVTGPAGTPEHEANAPTVAAVPAGGTIEIDGRLTEPVWQSAPMTDRFLQFDPVNGAPATQRTEVRFAFDEEHLYIGARMYDAAGPDGIVGRLARRDTDPSGDYVQFIFDTFLDHLGRVSFWINPAGVRSDWAAPANSNSDYSWDPIYRSATSIDAEGWSAELAIPFSQLRFPRGAEQAWGLQMWRGIQRLNEVQMWSFWRRNDQGGAARFGHLSGIRAPASGADRLTLLPYVTAQAETTADVDEDDPFAEEREGTIRIGGDLKYLVTSDLTLSATVNPDFGQAEVDPAVVNLSAFETFFPEKREFFIEGRGLFNYGGLWCFTCSNISSMDLLFTRRIGRAPQAAGLAFAAGDFAKVPDASTILGAAKVTGRTRGGTSVGLLSALTDREDADVFEEGRGRFEQEVEPLTSYNVARVKQDLFGGDLQVGGMLTSVVRRFDDEALEERLASHSEAVGVDAEWWWGNRTYHYLGNFAVSNVAGDEDAILRLQRSSARFLQRPDRDERENGFFTDAFDPTLDHLRGYGFYHRIAKEAGTFRWEASTAGRSPGFELNDIGFLTRTDFLWLHGNVQRRWSEPTSRYRYLQTTLGAQRKWNYDGDMVESQVHGSAYWQLPFYWETSLFGLFRPQADDDDATRGGPVVRSAAHQYLSWYLASDRRKRVYFEFEPSRTWTEEGGRRVELSSTVVYKPASSVEVSVGPQIAWDESRAQFVGAFADPTAEEFFGTRYVFSDLERTEFSMNTRVNWTFTPTMSLELFAQPLVSSNDFDRFKEFAAPRTLEKEVFGVDRGTIERIEATEDEKARYVVDPDGAGPAASFSFEDPDFNFRSLRGNLVFRWEYLPGSTLFLVWTQDRNTTLPSGEFDFGRDFEDLLGKDGNHVFLVKATYWIPL